MLELDLSQVEEVDLGLPSGTNDDALAACIMRMTALKKFVDRSSDQLAAYVSPATS